MPEMLYWIILLKKNDIVTSYDMTQLMLHDIVNYSKLTGS